MHEAEQADSELRVFFSLRDSPPSSKQVPVSSPYGGCSSAG